MKPLLPHVLLAGLLIISSAIAAERVPPTVRLNIPYKQQQANREAYQQTSIELKTWDANRPLPTSWQDTGLADDAKLVIIEYGMDGGTEVYHFKDGNGRYFVFFRGTPIHGQINDQGENVLIRTPLSQLRFFVGSPPPKMPNPVAVPIDSDCDKFLIGVLTKASLQQPPLPTPPRGDDWKALNDGARHIILDLKPEQRTVLGSIMTTVYLVQDITPDAVKDLPTNDLIELLAHAPNPLKKGEACTAIVIISLNQKDDLVRLEGYEAPADFYFSHFSKTQNHNFDDPLYAVFIYPVAAVHTHSIGTTCSINSPSFVQVAVPESYYRQETDMSGSGRMFR